MKNNFALFCLLISFCFFEAPTHAQSPDPALARLRDQFAVKYMQPEAHFELAKYYLDRGDDLQAFFIIEYARKMRFEEKDFDTAYTAFFGDPMPEPPNEAKDAFAAGSRLLSQGRYDEAEQFYQKAIKIDARSFYINAWVGRFYYKAKSDSARALPFYFKSYFLYPHAYESEYAEYRIRIISIADADRAFPELLKRGKALAELSRDRNPLIVGKAIEEMGKQWKPEYLKTMLECMSNDDSVIRWLAFLAVKEYAGPQIDEILTSLLADKDQRKRGLAAYGVVEHWKEKRFAILKKMLADPAELVRFDALSALALKGGPEGLQILKERLPHEPNIKLRLLIRHALNKQQ